MLSPSIKEILTPIGKEAVEKLRATFREAGVSKANSSSSSSKNNKILDTKEGVDHSSACSIAPKIDSHSKVPDSDHTPNVSHLQSQRISSLPHSRLSYSPGPSKISNSTRSLSSSQLNPTPCPPSRIPAAPPRHPNLQKESNSSESSGHPYPSSPKTEETHLELTDPVWTMLYLFLRILSTSDWPLLLGLRDELFFIIITAI